MGGNFPERAQGTAVVPLAVLLEAKQTAAGAWQVTLEAAAQDKFKFEPAEIVMEFDHAKNQMILKRNGRERVMRKEN